MTLAFRQAPPPAVVHRTADSVRAPSGDLWEVDSRSIADFLSNCTLTLETFFQASHVTQSGGVRSKRHTHVFRVQVVCSLDRHDAATPLPFHSVRDRLDALARSYVGQHLNDLPPFRNADPTTEHLTAVVFYQLDRMLSDLPLAVDAVTIHESPTQAATCRRSAR